ncbi:MAG: acetolactate synthase large subunit [Burkholderiaceae bacterium]|nr:acetolactate synthase large subunit [Burkholderiaceae bacterium]
MNGGESLVRTLLASGVDTCFANPGTSEMHFVAALDRVGGMRCVLGLAETVVTGCADGYARMSERPAATLLHLGPGLANGMANLHNARKSRTPVVNLVGDHASYHLNSGSLGTSDIAGMARTVSDWVRTSAAVSEVGTDAAAAVQAARNAPGQVATLILPADMSWSEGGRVAEPLTVAGPQAVSGDTIASVARVLRRREPTVLLLWHQALSEEGLRAAQRVASVSGAVLRTSATVPRMARGQGRPAVDRIPYNIDPALQMLSGVRHVILVGANMPAPFFAYPGKPHRLAPPDASIHVLARAEQDQVGALLALADELGAPPGDVPLPAVPRPVAARGAFSPDGFADTLAALLPENCIVADDAVTSGRSLIARTHGAAPHDWLMACGGAIGHALPCATGAAIACPERRLVCLQADGAGMYTLQSLWTQARENLDVVTVIFANRVYKILYGELAAVGAQPGPASNALFDLGRPELDWTLLARGMGVEAARVDTLEGFADVFRAACARRGPFLIEFFI